MGLNEVQQKKNFAMRKSPINSAIMKIISSALLAFIFLSGCKSPAPPKFNETLFTNLGHYQMKVTTKNPWTQKFFNQGFILAYAFNHAEAEKSFREAARLDSNCAMCYWGEALVNGPNINAPMMDTVYAKTYAMVQKAKSKMRHRIKRKH
jgi:hypothetical protein